MNCQICKIRVFKVIKILKKVKIFECTNCHLGFIEQKVISSSFSLQNNKNELYDFESYKKEEAEFKKRINKLAKVITRYKKSGRVLDIGAGFGLFSTTLQRNGNFHFDLIEPETSLKYFDKLKQPIIKTTFEKFKTKRKYDVILMIDVLEHFKDPLENLKKAKLLLEEGGILVIQTPNYKSLMAKICKNWAWWMIEDHKFFFSPKSLKKILNKTGFNVEYFMTYEDWADFKKNLDGNFTDIKNTFIRKMLKAFFFSIFFPVYFLTRKVLWKLNYGGLMYTIAK